MLPLLLCHTRQYSQIAVVGAVRAAKFVARKQWIVCGSDDMYIRVYNYNTMDKVKAFEAHTDYIRCVQVAALLGA
jgi:hypothetical protein